LGVRISVSLKVHSWVGYHANFSIPKGPKSFPSKYQMGSKMNAVDPLLNQDSLGKPLVEPVADPWQVRGYQSWIMVKMRLDTIGFSGIRLLDRPI
jgi:hypothetical protein